MMLRQWIPALALLALSGGCGMGVPDEAAGLDVVHRGERFAMNLPQGWTARESSGPVAFFAVGPESGGTAPSVTVSVEQSMGTLAPESLAGLTQDRLARLTGFRLVGEEKFTLADGRPALVITFEHQGAGAPVLQRQLVVTAGARTYFITATTAAGRLREDGPAFDLVFRSFRAGW